MVLCKHFQQGYCRFGSKCNFEHIDIKQLVKNDVEGALNGHQFLFSCYGPFKDKPCVPNFIEDQSFEELRLMCMEAKKKNCFDQFHQQYAMGAAEAMNKMKALLQPSYEIMNILMMIYDAPAATSNNASLTNSSNATSNPFSANTQTDTGASSIFGKSSVPVSSGGNSVFGGSGNIFGANANNTVQASSIFGGQNSLGTQQQSSIFGQQSQQSNTGSIFGGIAKPTLFNQQQTTTSAGVGSSSVFGQTSQQTAPLFNQQSSFGQQQPQQLMQPQQSSVGFGQNAFNQQQMQQNFGSPQQQPQTQNLYGQTAPMGQQPTAVGTNIFAQAMQQSNPGAPPSQGFFQQAGQQQMGVQQQMQQLQQQTNTQQPQDLTRNQIPQTIPQSNAADSAYSKLEDLTAAEIEAFKADFFEPGKIPFSPPPIELLN